MSTTLLILVALFAGFVLLSRRTQRTTSSRTSANEAAAKQDVAQKKSAIPSVYAVRSVNRYLGRKSLKPRLMMWGIGLFVVAGGIALISPKMFLENIVRFGPAILCVLIGFAVIGFGNSMEEEYESYEYSRLGWGIGLTMFFLGAVALFK